MKNNLLSLVERIRFKRNARRDAEDDWVTIKGTHVLLGEEGEALSGGKLKGMKFSNAKSVRYVSKAVREKMSGVKRAVVKVAKNAVRYIPNGLIVTVNGERWQSRKEISNAYYSLSTGEYIDADKFTKMCESAEGDVEVSAFNVGDPTYENAVEILNSMNTGKILDRDKESIERSLKTSREELEKWKAVAKQQEDRGFAVEDWIKRKVKMYQKDVDVNERDLAQYAEYDKIHAECVKAVRAAYESSGESILRPKSLLGFARGKEMTIEQADNKNPNPKWKPLSEGPNPSTAYHNNCQTCVAVYEARLRGYNVSAGMWQDSPDNPLYKLSKDFKNAWIDPETGMKPEGMRYKGRRRADSSFKWLRESMEDGARYNLRVGWKGSWNGHVICASKENGQVKLYDPQINKTITEPDEIRAYFKRTSYDYNELLRVDNLMLNSEALNGALEKNENPVW